MLKVDRKEQTWTLPAYVRLTHCEEDRVSFKAQIIKADAGLQPQYKELEAEGF